MLKATSVNRYGCESVPASLQVNGDGYVEIPENPDAVAYHLYAPMVGFETSGPWYLFKIIRRRIARQARFTIAAVDYDTSDLIAKLCRDALDTLNPPYVIEMPPPLPGQTHWSIHGGGPYAIIECPEVR